MKNQKTLETKIENLIVSFEDGSEVIKLCDYDFKKELFYQNYAYSQGFYAFSENQIIFFFFDNNQKAYFPINEEHPLFSEIITYFFQFMYLELDFCQFVYQLFAYYESPFPYQKAYQNYLEAILHDE